MSSSICFHCIICFESFDCNEHYPVVLPCGHTYVCVECANRIDRCYECREKLFYYVEDENKSSSVPTQNNSQYRSSRSAYGGRRVSGAYQDTQPRKPVIKIKKRLPLPKNLVLMSLIEANQYTSQVQKDVAKILYGKEDSDNTDNNDEEFDVGLHVFLESRVCGTYMVTCRNGLSVHARKPKKTVLPLNTAIASIEIDKGLNHSNLYETEFGTTNPWSSQERQQRASVNFGDHLQVIAIEDGWAILARQNGYISADESKLMRVSGSRDKICRSEGILYNLFVHWKEIEKNHNKVQRLKKDLINELKLSLSSSSSCDKHFVADLTVVPATDSEKEILESKLKKEETQKLEEEKKIREKEEKKRHPEVREAPESKHRLPQREKVKGLPNHHDVHPDMRTGRSGHCALLSAKKVKAHSTPQVDSLPKRSAHTGLTRPKVHD